MEYFQKVINGQPRSVKDVVFQILHFLPDEDLKNVYNTHYVLHPLLNKIPRTPFCYTIRTSLEITFNCNRDILLKIKEIPIGDVITFAPLITVGNDGGYTFCMHDNPQRFWYLMRSSIFSYIEFNIGSHRVLNAPSGLILHTWLMTLVTVTHIIKTICRPILCYRILYTEIHHYSSLLKSELGKYFVQLPIPLSN